MINTILGTKSGMSQAFVEGVRVPVTLIQAGPCMVTQVKSEDKDGYWSIQIGFGLKRVKNVTKPLQGHLKGAISGKMAPRFLREIRLKKEPELKVGDILNIKDIFKKGDKIAVTGKSKGKGFAGVVKRWHFRGGPKTHGQSDRHRAPGSIGQGTTPGRVLKAKKMAGRMGGDTITIKNLVVIDVDEEKNMLTITGPVPGIKEGLLKIKRLHVGKLDELVHEIPKVEVGQKENTFEDKVKAADKTEKETESKE